MALPKVEIVSPDPETKKQRQDLIKNLEKQIIAELKSQRIKKREYDSLFLLKQRLKQTKTGESLDSILYRAIF